MSRMRSSSSWLLSSTSAPGTTVGGRSGGTQPVGSRQCRLTARLASRLTCSRRKGGPADQDGYLHLVGQQRRQRPATWPPVLTQAGARSPVSR